MTPRDHGALLEPLGRDGKGPGLKPPQGANYQARTSARAAEPLGAAARSDAR